MIKALLLVALIATAASQTVQQDQVNPVNIGWPANYPGKIYSGYLDVYGNGSLLTHYVLLKSLSAVPGKDPLVLWLNGGPGCSSLIGLMQEIGPQLFLGYNTTLQPNLENAWNQHANVLYLESPPGVGFSINNITNYTFTDDNTAETNFLSLNLFLDRFPGYASSQFWIAGESYGGIYIPYLANQIKVNNENPPANYTPINLNGFLIGNGAWILDWTMIGTYQNTTYYTHQFFNDEDKEAYFRYCFGKANSPKCKFVKGIAENIFNNTDHYSIYSYTYNYAAGGGDYVTPQIRAFIKTMQNKFPKAANQTIISPETTMTNYFNNVTIQQGWNVYSTVQKYFANNTFEWGMCNDAINQGYQSANDSTHLYPGLLQSGYQILTYSGNTDAAVPFTYTEYCINDLFQNFGVNLTEVQPWSLWNPQADKQLGGWVQTWENRDRNPGAPQNNFTFAVVRGAGHEVPMYQPAAAYYMFTRFINGETI